jgi:hypothetical protein
MMETALNRAEQVRLEDVNVPAGMTQIELTR